MNTPRMLTSTAAGIVALSVAAGLSAGPAVAGVPAPAAQVQLVSARSALPPCPPKVKAKRHVKGTPVAPRVRHARCARTVKAPKAKATVFVIYVTSDDGVWTIDTLHTPAASLVALNALGLA